MKTGDVLACIGHGLISDTIAGLSRLRPNAARFGFIPSHVAIMWNGLLVAESSSDADGADSLTGLPRKGVQYHGLDGFLENYVGTVYHVPMHAKLTPVAEAAICGYLDRIHTEGWGYDWPGVMGLGLQILFGNRLYLQPDYHSLFCSELVTNALYEGRVIDKLTAADQTPADVIGWPCFGPPVLLREDKRVKVQEDVAIWRTKILASRGMG